MKNVLRHFFIPHAGNNHRAKALHLDMMLFYVVAFALFNVSLKFVSQSYPDVLGYATNIQVEQLLAETNARRTQAGLAPLTLNDQLSQAAARKAADMFAKNYWAHVAPDGRTPWDFIINAGYKYQVAGENLAKNFQDSTGVVNAWMASPSHRDNLLKSNYKEVGFAVVNGTLQGEETTLVVQMFGTKPAAVAEAPAKVAPQKAEVPAVIPAPAEKSAEKPVVIPEVASVTETKPQTQGFLPSIFSSVVKAPRFDVVALRRDISMAFIGMLLGILMIDVYVAYRRHTVRAVGSTMAHVLFLVGMFVSMNVVLRGTIL